MKLTKIDQIDEFLAAVDRCNKAVWLTSMAGDKYNLKSYLSRYIAIAALLGEHGDELELWCDDTNEEQYFFKFFNNHPEVLK